MKSGSHHFSGRASIATQSPECERSSFAHLSNLLPIEELGGFEDARFVDQKARSFNQQTELARILFRRKRGHVLLTGAGGVGKRSLLRGFALRIARGEFPFLSGIRVVMFDVSNVGPEDSRACLETIFAAANELEDAILCLHGISALIKREHGGTNKPLLRTLMNRSSVKVIGTMTDWEYADHVANNAGMLEVFDRVRIAEPGGEELRTIVAQAAGRLSEEYEIAISAAAVERAIVLSSTFLLSEAHPAKAIDVLRQACEELAFERTQRPGEPPTEPSAVPPGCVIDVISRRTGIPHETISGQGRECDFRAALCEAVVGQKRAVEEAAMELQLISAGLTEPNKPASVIMFTGMTGVGKTELAKRIAEFYSTSRRLQVYSMGNFTESHSVSGIIGVPPGYVGHEEGGRLINELRADPYSVFLLDEAEKCHPNVWKPFLHLFDEGWIVDQRGVKAYADRAIFILTTNAGDRNISQLMRSGKSPEEILQNVRQSLSRVRQERSSQPVFPPQFLSRMKRILGSTRSTRKR